MLNGTNVQVTVRTEYRQRMHFVRTVISYVYMEQRLPKGGSGKLPAEFDFTNTEHMIKNMETSEDRRGKKNGLNMYVRSAVDLSPATRN